MRTRRFARLAAPILIFLLAFVPRAIYPVSRPMQWYNRAVRFGDAVLAQDWAGTYERYHPGVTTMWLSGIGIKVFSWGKGLSSEQLLGAAPTKPGVLNGAVAAGVVPLALVIALSIVLSYTLLNRIAGPKVALVGGCLLALDPFYITYSKVLHVDALLAAFMLTSALFLLSYLHRLKRLDLILSGLFAGLAFLTKSPSFFLVPYAALAVGACKLLPETSGEWLGWLRWFRDIAGSLLVWGAVAAVVFVALWPAMWVEPLHALRRIGVRIGFHIETAHYNPVYFNGEITQKDPGLLFYLATVAWKTTLVTLPMVCAGVLSAVLQLLRGKRDVVLWLFLAYAVFFTAQMCLGARKELRYLLPAFPALSIVAAFGLARTADAVASTLPWRSKNWLPWTVITGALVLQAAMVLPRHPYYGTLHNRLLGGSQMAQRILPFQDQGEGLDLAGRYLNTLPRAQRATAGLFRLGASVFRRNFLGLTSSVSDPRANYRVYYVNQVMRQLGDEAWEEVWRADRQREPLWTIAFDDVTYVWVYGAPPAAPAAGGPEEDVDYQFGEHIRLARVRISADVLSPGDELTVVPVWTSDGEVERSYKVFCHIMSEDRELAAQRDGFPLNGVRQTPSWRAGERIEDSYGIQLPEDLPPGEYQLSLGMYDPESMERLPVYDGTGKPVPHRCVVLGSVRVEASGADGQ